MIGLEPTYNPSCVPFKYGSADNLGIIMIDYCPKVASATNSTQYSDKTDLLTKHCEAYKRSHIANFSLELYHFIPVTSSLGVHYANYYCAACHGVSKFDYWKLLITSVSRRKVKQLVNYKEKYVDQILTEHISSLRLPPFYVKGEIDRKEMIVLLNQSCFHAEAQTPKVSSKDCISKRLQDTNVTWKSWIRCISVSRFGAFDLTFIVKNGNLRLDIDPLYNMAVSPIDSLIWTCDKSNNTTYTSFDLDNEVQSYSNNCTLPYVKNSCLLVPCVSNLVSKITNHALDLKIHGYILRHLSFTCLVISLLSLI